MLFINHYRTIKNRLRQELRDKMKLQRATSEDSFNHVFLNTFNLALGWNENDKKSSDFWRETKKGVLDYFCSNSLDSDEKLETYDIRSDIIELLFPRMMTLIFTIKIIY
jgi:hypothetical protein